MRNIKWKYKAKVNTYEGTIKGDKEPLIFIGGGLYVTDLRESRKSDCYISPKHYKVIGLSIDERKQLAEDLVSGDNFDKHEQNRLAWIAENDRVSKKIQEVDEFIKSLQEKKKNDN